MSCTPGAIALRLKASSMCFKHGHLIEPSGSDLRDSVKNADRRGTRVCATSKWPHTQGSQACCWDRPRYHNDPTPEL